MFNSFILSQVMTNTHYSCSVYLQILGWNNNGNEAFEFAHTTSNTFVTKASTSPVEASHYTQVA